MHCKTQPELSGADSCRVGRLGRIRAKGTVSFESTAGQIFKSCPDGDC